MCFVLFHYQAKKENKTEKRKENKTLRLRVEKERNNLNKLLLKVRIEKKKDRMNKEKKKNNLVLKPRIDCFFHMTKLWW